jgi:sialate O-acetylesterase
MDTGDLNDIHPKDKVNVGHRLALAARHVAYGENIVYSGPIFTSIKTEGTKVRVSFQCVGGGLVIGSAPTSRATDQPVPKADCLNGFEIAGVDNKQFFPAQAQIEGDSVVVSSDAVPQPTAVRYGWTAYPTPPINLYNKEGLPASPFNSLEGAPVLPASH